MIFSYLATLFGVCGLAVGALMLLRAVKCSGLSLRVAQPIRIVGRQAVGAGASLLLVDVDGRQMLIAVSRSGVSLLEVRPKTHSNVVPIESGFSATLKRAGTRW